MGEDTESAGLLRQALSSSRAAKYAKVGLALVTSFACLAFLGRSLAGAPTWSTARMILRPLAQASVAALLFGFLGTREWARVAKAGSIPALILGLFLFVGTVLEGHTDQAYLLSMPFGMIAGVFLFCWIGGRLGRLFF